MGLTRKGSLAAVGFAAAGFAAAGFAAAIFAALCISGAPPARAAGCNLKSGQGCVLAAPPAGKLYHAAYPEFGGSESAVTSERIRSFERLAGRGIAWAYFSNNWFGGRIPFPKRQVRVILSTAQAPPRARKRRPSERGRSRAVSHRIPFIRMMARTGFGAPPDPNYSMSAIVSGAWDPGIHRWCRTAASIRSPLLVEFGTEANGDWFPWNGVWNGGGELSGYGDPSAPDGPERFRDAYRRIIDICRAEGAGNVTWFYHADVGSSPNVGWNKPWSYYPGDDYIDWIGLSDYGALRSGGWWAPLAQRMDRALPPLLSHLGRDKPIAVLEMGVAEQFRDRAAKPRWIRHAFKPLLQRRWPEIRAAAWWNEQWRNSDESVSDLHIDSSRLSLRAYRDAARSRRLTSRAYFRAR